MSYEIKLPLFEGPFDLLLFFIERDEIDIMDIPISKITNDFFEYISDLESMNIEVASEFIVVAATLMRIKSKMLLPRLSLDEEGNEIDPREELVEHLIEYKKYKSVISEFSDLEDSRLSKKIRGNLESEVGTIAERAKVESELQDIDLYKLLVVFQNVLSKYENEKNKPKHQIFEYPYTITEQKKFLINLLKSKLINFEASPQINSLLRMLQLAESIPQSFIPLNINGITFVLSSFVLALPHTAIIPLEFV